MNPEQLLFAKTHEWVSVADEDGGKVVTVGLSAFAIEALTDLVYLELPDVGAQTTAAEPFCEVESVKAVSDLYAPVTGKVIQVNDGLPNALETLSNDPYGAGWIAKIVVNDDSALANLMDHAAYQAMCEEEG